MTTELERIDAIRERILERFGPEPPRWIFVLGSGMGDLRGIVEQSESAAYEALGIPHPGVDSHEGRLAFGTVAGQRVACLSGRIHLYEGYEPPVLVRGLRALIRHADEQRPTVVLTAAAGTLRPEWWLGSVVCISDHINFSGRNVLGGPNIDALGERFPDISDLYDHALRKTSREQARHLGIDLQEGVYVSSLGPSYESPAEIRVFRQWGADMVGMSLVHEAIAAKHAEARVLAFAVVSNFAAGLADHRITHKEVKREVPKGAAKLARLLPRVIAHAPPHQG